MNKRSIFLALALSLASNAFSIEGDTENQTAHVTQAEKRIKHIFCDLHGVVLVKNPRTFICGGFGNFLSTKETVKGKISLLGQFTCLIGHIIFGMLVNDFRFHEQMYELFNLKNENGDKIGKNKVTESYFSVIKNLGYVDVHDALVSFANNIFVPNTKLIAALKELKRKGHKLHMFSNIGNETLEDARKKFPELLELFEGQENSINQKSPKNGIYTQWKPQRDAYNAALEYAGAEPEDSIMIDDKLANLPTTEGAHAAEQKAVKKGYSLETADPVWAGGVVYNLKKHDAAIKQLEALLNT